MDTNDNIDTNNNKLVEELKMENELLKSENKKLKEEN